MTRSDLNEAKVTAKTLRIINEKGLHARASAKFVEVVEGHDAAASVTKDGMTVSGDSIMGLLMLAASRGTAPLMSSRCAVVHHRRCSAVSITVTLALLTTVSEQPASSSGLKTKLSSSALSTAASVSRAAG